jgi:hypothetical protein
VKPPTITLAIPWFVNPDCKDFSDVEDYYETRRVRCEVLSVHFEKETMRVRYYDGGRPKTSDMNAKAFLRRLK